MTSIKLGDAVKERVTGYRGIAVVRKERISGYVEYGIQSPELTDEGNVRSLEWFDAEDLTSLGPIDRINSSVPGFHGGEG